MFIKYIDLDNLKKILQQNIIINIIPSYLDNIIYSFISLLIFYYLQVK